MTNCPTTAPLPAFTCPRWCAGHHADNANLANGVVHDGPIRTFADHSPDGGRDVHIWIRMGWFVDLEGADPSAGIGIGNLDAEGWVHSLHPDDVLSIAGAEFLGRALLGAVADWRRTEVSIPTARAALESGVLR